MRLQQCELKRYGNSCTVQIVTLGQRDEHPQSAVKCSFIGLVKALVVAITVTKHFKSEQSLYGNKIEEQARPSARAQAARLPQGSAFEAP